MTRLLLLRLSSLVAACALLLGAIAPAHAHKASDSYLRIDARAATMQVQWDIALRDLELAIGLDADGDDAITWDELRDRQLDVVAYATSRLRLRADGQECPLTFTKLQVDRHSDGTYAGLHLTSPCSGRSLELDYRLFFDLDAQHRGLVKLQTSAGERALAMSPERAVQRIALSGGEAGPRSDGDRASAANSERAATAGSALEAGALDRFVQFVGEGVWHIWIGVDHILFLLSLLLPLLALRGGRAPIATQTLAWDIAKIVTAFTVAHSLTLAAATLGWVRVPAQWTETAIAATVLLVALLNLFSRSHARRWSLAFVLGLVHGLGFASVLSDLGLSAGSLITSLLAFNIGVEVGQLAIVAVFVLATFAWARRASFRPVALRGGSLAIGLIAAGWIVERW